MDVGTNNRSSWEDRFSPLFFSTVLKSHCNCPHLKVTHVHFIPVQEGLLSHVRLVELTYDQDDAFSTEWPTQLLLKTMVMHEGKEEEDNSMGRRMFATEARFYSDYASQLMLQASFQVPQLIQATSTWIVMQYIPNVTCHSLIHGGCPASKVDFCLQQLAQLHACQWGVKWTELETPPGMGALLDATQKLQQFHENHSQFLQRLVKKEVSKSKSNSSIVPSQPSRDMLQALIHWSNLSTVHNQVYEPKWTIIHGDYHIGNWLFTTATDDDDDSDNKNAWLVDWGSCGIGNPFIDVVFFFLVSTSLDVSTLQDVITQYYNMLTDTHTSTNAQRIRQTLSLEQCLDLVRLVVINQLLIFIAYDPMVRQLGGGKVVQNHFDKVHSRAVQTMLTSFIDYSTLFQ